MIFVFLILLCESSSFLAGGYSRAMACRAPTRGLLNVQMTDGGLDDSTREKLEGLVNNNKVLLFMKGNKLFPQCGFSNTACRILDAISVPYETVNVLEDDRIRNGVKVFSSWPTIPQLYVDGEFLGGADIMIEMYQSGELQQLIEVAVAS